MNGSLIETEDGNLLVRTSQAKWDKGKGIVESWWNAYQVEEIQEGRREPDFDHKVMRSERGFMVSLVRTYHWINPLTKGVHNTLENWRDKRDEDG